MDDRKPGGLFKEAAQMVLGDIEPCSDLFDFADFIVVLVDVSQDQVDMLRRQGR
ncbi:hypothetical protein D3C73_1430060 [compost metagenome]